MTIRRGFVTQIGMEYEGAFECAADRKTPSPPRWTSAKRSRLGFRWATTKDSQTTHEDIAARMGCAPNTASEYLQKAESKLIAAVMDR